MKTMIAGAVPAERSRPILEVQLVRWSTFHAALLATAGIAAALGASMALVSTAAALSFATLVFVGRAHWTPAGAFGAANVVTFLRIAGILALPALPAGPVLAAAALLWFALDGIDGWIARRLQLAGPFGAFADKEGDALLVLVLCLLLYRLPDGPGAWILVPGMLRYAFVLFVAVAKPPEDQERRSTLGVWIAGFTMAALVVAFAAYPTYFRYARWLLAAATLVLCLSFAVSLYRIYRPRPDGAN